MSPISSYHSILKPLSWVRGVAIGLQVGYLFWLSEAPSLIIWVILSLQVMTLVQTVVANRSLARQGGLFAALLLDTLLLAAYVYLTGGIANPLISLLLLPIATAAVMLDWRYAMSLLLVAVACYSALLAWMEPTHGHHNYQAHLTGMWLVFIASALLLYYLVSELVKASREQQKALQEYKQRQLRDDYLLALGVAAADAAHQLNTPLSSLAVLIDELSEAEDKAVMQQQIMRCQQITQSIQQQFEQLKYKQFQQLRIDQMLSQLTTSFRLLHPDIELQLQAPAADRLAQYRLDSHLGLVSALLNLMDNAAKASLANQSQRIQLLVTLRDEQLRLQVKDFGVGIELRRLQDYGLNPSPGSQRGMGIGSLISSASIELMGGVLGIANHQQGAQVTVLLPITPVTSPAQEPQPA